MCVLQEENEWYIDISFNSCFEFSKKLLKRKKQDILFNGFCQEIDSVFGMELINSENVSFEKKESCQIFFSFCTTSLTEMECNLETVEALLNKYQLNRFLYAYKD